MDNIKDKKEYFANDRFATEALGAVIDDVGENTARVSVELTEKHKNARGEIMGGVYFTLADFCFAVSTNNSEKSTVSTVCQISYLRPIKGNKLIAVSELIKDGRSTCYYMIELWDDLGNKVAFVSMSGMHLDNKQ